MTVFSGENITSFRGGRLVLRALDFRIEEGGALLLTGPNGSGKSTLLRLMAGLLDPIEGRFLWDGADVRDDPEGHRSRLHYLGHAEAIKPVLTVREDLNFWADLSDTDRASRDEIVTQAISAVGLERQADLPGRYLSAGQRRRTALARLFTTGAHIWLLDEPSVGLDKAATKQLAGVIEAHRAKGGIIIAATHIDLGLEGAKNLDVGQFAVSPNMAGIQSDLDLGGAGVTGGPNG